MKYLPHDVMQKDKKKHKKQENNKANKQQNKNINRIFTCHYTSSCKSEEDILQIFESCRKLEYFICVTLLHSVLNDDLRT
jgi:NCAIR mutase (PurE)-related protein